jgi:hypothetical protein
MLAEKAAVTAGTSRASRAWTAGANRGAGRPAVVRARRAFPRSRALKSALNIVVSFD